MDGQSTPEDGIAAGGQRARWWGRPLAASVTAVATLAVLTMAAIAQSPPAKAGAHGKPVATATGPARTSAAPSPPARASAEPSAKPSVLTATPTPAATAAPSIRRAVAALPGDRGHLAVAVADEDSDAVATYQNRAGDDDGAHPAYHTYDTASIVKVDILAALLLRAQKKGTHLKAGQRRLATSMIESSDNNAADALWDAIGGRSGLNAANRTLGLDHTSAGPGPLWGLTQTTAGDQVTLLRAVFGDDSPLSPSSRSYIAGLMRSVTAGQRWGVSAADSDDAGYALKNGWLPRSATGLWDINSIGEVTYEGHRLLICVLSSGQPSQGAGIDLAEDAAEAAAKAFTAGLGSPPASAPAPVKALAALKGAAADAA